MSSPYRCGYVAIVGRPNVGKSTLMNRLIGHKISITSRKPQTTRHRILGVRTTPEWQAVFVDTPGLHLAGKKAVNRYMNRAATSALRDVDLILFVVDAQRWTEEDQHVLDRLQGSTIPVILVLNKVDRIKEKERLLPLLARAAERIPGAGVVPLSALNRDNLERLERSLPEHLPPAEPLFPEDQITDRSERFMAAEIVREKLMRTLGDELPYAVTVEVEQFRTTQRVVHINALIWVERESQKKIVIGKGGEQLKRIGSKAREEMEQLLAQKVNLQLWVKVKAGWSDDERSLRSLGYADES